MCVCVFFTGSESFSKTVHVGVDFWISFVCLCVCVCFFTSSESFSKTVHVGVDFWSSFVKIQINLHQDYIYSYQLYTLVVKVHCC